MHSHMLQSEKENKEKKNKDDPDDTRAPNRAR